MQPRNPMWYIEGSLRSHQWQAATCGNIMMALFMQHQAPTKQKSIVWSCMAIRCSIFFLALAGFSISQVIALACTLWWLPELPWTNCTPSPRCLKAVDHLCHHCQLPGGPANGDSMGNPRIQCFKMGRKLDWRNYAKPTNLMFQDGKKTPMGKLYNRKPKNPMFKMGRKLQWGNYGKPKNPMFQDGKKIPMGKPWETQTSNKQTHKKNNVVNEVPG